MKIFSGHSGAAAAVVVLVALSLLVAGCIQPAAQQTTPTVSPGLTASPATPVPGGTPVSTSLPYGITLSVPGDWTRQDVLASGARDYGATTINIANFYSPTTIPGDPESYVTLSVDLDQNPGADFERYFNSATLAVGNTYGNLLVKDLHSYTITVSGYKTYELDFRAPAVRGNYLFTSTENGMYIFAFKAPEKPRAVQEFQDTIPGIQKSIRINPPAVTVTPHR